MKTNVITVINAFITGKQHIGVAAPAGFHRSVPREDPEERRPADTCLWNRRLP
jgi:hypothetical protein